MHLIGSIGSGAPDRAAEAIDHVALRIDDYADFRGRLDRLAIRYSPKELPELAERRLFLRAPGGPLIEADWRETSVHRGTPSASTSAHQEAAC